MPRPSWKGVLRLSLVSCPVYLMPATTRTKAIRLNQVWVSRAPPPSENEDDIEEEPQVTAPRRGFTGRDAIEPAPPPNPLLTSPEPTGAATRISLRPHDPYTGAEVERTEVVKGYEYDPGLAELRDADDLTGPVRDGSRQARFARTNHHYRRIESQSGGPPRRLSHPLHAPPPPPHHRAPPPAGRRRALRPGRDGDFEAGSSHSPASI